MNFKFKRLYHRVFSIFLVIVLSVISVPTSAVAKEGNEEPLNISTSAPISDSTIATDLSQEVIWPVMSDEEAMRREQLIQNGYSPDDYSASEYKQMAARGELQPLAVYPAVLADGVYAIKNIGNSSGSTGFYLDTALAHWLPGYNMQQYKFTNGGSPLDNFSTSALFKITRNTEKGSYIIRIMRNNVLSFGIHVNSDGSNEILTKKIPLDDSEVALNDTYVITASGSGYYIRKYGTTNLIATKETTASGAAGAPDSYLYASTAIGDQTRWTFSAYTGPERNEMTILGSGSLEVAKTSTLDPVFYSTRPGYNVVSLNMSQVPTSYYHLSGPSDYGIYYVTPRQDNVWTVSLYLKNGSTSNASSILVKTETWNIALPIDEGVYYFRNAKHTSKYIQIDNDVETTATGASMELHNYDGYDDQRWKLVHIGDGFYYILSMESGKVLTAPTSIDNNITQAFYTGVATQQWCFSFNSSGSYKIFSKSTPSYCIAASGGITLTARKVQLRAVQTDSSDNWIIYRSASLNAYKESSSSATDLYMSNASLLLEASNYGLAAKVTTDFYSSLTVPEVINRLENNGIFIIHTHGDKTSIVTGPETSLEMSDLSNSDLSNLHLVILLACNVGIDSNVAHITNNQPVNITEQMVVSGAQTSIGFNGETICDDNNEFIVALLDSMINDGLPLDAALEKLNYDEFTNEQYRNLIEIVGNRQIKIHRGG